MFNFDGIQLGGKKLTEMSYVEINRAFQDVFKNQPQEVSTGNTWESSGRSDVKNILALQNNLADQFNNIADELDPYRYNPFYFYLLMLIRGTKFEYQIFHEESRVYSAGSNNPNFEEAEKIIDSENFVGVECDLFKAFQLLSLPALKIPQSFKDAITSLFLPENQTLTDTWSAAKQAVEAFLQPYQENQTTNLDKIVKFDKNKYDEAVKYFKFITFSFDKELLDKGHEIDAIRKKYEAEEKLKQKIDEFLKPFWNPKVGDYEVDRKVPKINIAFTDDDMEIMARLERYIETNKKLEPTTQDKTLVELNDKLQTVLDIYTVKHEKLNSVVKEYSEIYIPKQLALLSENKRKNFDNYKKVFVKKPFEERNVNGEVVLITNGIHDSQLGLDDEEKRTPVKILAVKAAVGEKLTTALKLEHASYPKQLVSRIACYRKKLNDAAKLLNREGKVFQYNRTPAEVGLLVAAGLVFPPLGITLGILAFASLFNSNLAWWKSESAFRKSESESKILGTVEKAGVEIDIPTSTTPKLSPGG